MVQAIEPGSYARPWSEEAAKEDPTLRPNVWVTRGEQRWPYWRDETTVSQGKKVRAATGKGVQFWLNEFSESWGAEIDSWAVVCWLARMQNGEPSLTLADVEDGLKYGDDIGMVPGHVEVDDPEDEDESPEA